ncbi:MAG: zinc-dependent metalloprotease [Crocinitomicaceae bacterium]|nr:zinc-dependent metalloprotease [Crocinitomicaceae bacterium]
MKITANSILRFALFAVLVFSVQGVYGQRRNRNKGDVKKEVPSKDAPKKISELTKKSTKFEGLFTMYQDSVTGKMYMLITEDQIGHEFIYFSQVANGVAGVRGFRGNYKGSKVFKIEKYFNKIEFITQNTSSYFDPENALIRAADANMPDAIMASLKIEGINDDETAYLIDADKLFLTETFSQVKPPKFPGSSPFSFSLGSLDKDKSKVDRVRSYPENTDIAVEYVYSRPSVLNGGNRDVTDGRNVSITVFHSLIAMPDNDYVPLIDDPRVGYFLTEVTDMTSPENANYRDLVHRWHLVKKDPSAELSEPVEPIVWWMENTTPENLRPIIKAAAEQWNIAFEQAGFKNALIVKQQPDDADWDAGDIRYNVLRWTASPFPPFGGYGPSFVNPRTGQILGADIMFEYRSVLGRLRAEEFFSEPTGAEGEEMVQLSSCSHPGCEASQVGAVNTSFASLILQYIDGEPIEDSKMIQEYLHYLVLHEIGHTLGLNHNMKASQLHDLATIHNMEITGAEGLMGSVMDYPSINVALDRSQQGHYFTKRPGPYDLWAIQFAYEPNRTEAETMALLNRSTEHDLMFGNDADDMRSPGKAIDPRVNIYDLTSDAVEYAVERMELVKILATEVRTKYDDANTSHHDQFIAYLSLLRQYRDAANVTSRYIGGVYIDRAMNGQAGATQPYTPVDLAQQKLAMKSLNDYIFSPTAFDFGAELYNHIQPQRRGFNHFMATEDPKIHSYALRIQTGAIAHLLHRNTMQRIVDSELYGNEYTLSAFMKDLTDGIFKADISGNVNSFRQNLQIAYAEKLISIVQSDKYMNVAKSHAVYFLKEIRKMVANGSGDISTKAHKAHLSTLIDNALKEIK